MVSPKIKNFAALKGKSVALEQYSVSHFVLAIGIVVLIYAIAQGLLPQPPRLPRRRSRILVVA